MNSMFDFAGNVSALSQLGSSLLATTQIDGIHLIHSGGADVATLKAEQVSDSIVCAGALISSTLAVVGDKDGRLHNIDWSLAARTCSCKHHDSHIVTLATIPGAAPHTILVASNTDICLVDMRSLTSHPFVSLQRPCVGVAAATDTVVAVAAVDGGVLLFDLRRSSEPLTVLMVDDQLTCLSANGRGCVVAGTVGGRAVMLRASQTNETERALATGSARHPVRSISAYADIVVCGGEDGQASILDFTCSLPTEHWVPPTLSSTPFDAVPAVVISEAQGVAWGAFTASDGSRSYVAAKPLQFPTRCDAEGA